MVPETEYSTSLHDLPLIHLIETPSSIITYIHSCPVTLLPTILDQEKSSERTRPMPRLEITSSLLIPEGPIFSPHQENLSSRHIRGEPILSPLYERDAYLPGYNYASGTHCSYSIYHALVVASKNLQECFDVLTVDVYPITVYIDESRSSVKRLLAHE